MPGLLHGACQFQEIAEIRHFATVEKSFTRDEYLRLGFFTEN
jgi:hypothetical protein